ncbi:protein-methionine-sulfoxide reductase heme-binding subunit MsrQ [Vibrio sp. SS-MA-C1-2]|uniref:protein-methionine-sulfoxide reductase heme-binding subunit MsrQ n=1 Tax=Vibrio sp. SS-MA-C1-2 TaxID=2908646 RepID=UPI001F2A745E|nr:protein-methionine-sulfoxide reductase heme-binding subunit MsrQ [Vibrio sp. SS-MA-C1-2]UJF17401.1 protein-methionine-sulfoxide reductase heme-binding subunit MsrQ [Vibrio sp. SS-MA-C1-2]
MVIKAKKRSVLSSTQILLLKVLIHLLSLGFIVAIYPLALRGYFGADPTPEIIHYTGKGALHLLLISLIISPLAKRLKQGGLIRVRRLVGIYCFIWASLHLFSYSYLDLGFDWSLIGSELVKRPYLTLGALSWILLFALTLTSLNTIRKKMGVKWQKLHNFIYLVAIIAPIHYLWSVKSGIIEPAIYLIFSLWLLSLRKSKFVIFKSNKSKNNKLKSN